MAKRIRTSVAVLAVVGIVGFGLAACDNQLLAAVQSAVIEAQSGGVPEVIGTNPSADQTGVASSIIVTATFAAPIDPATLTTDTFVLRKDTLTVVGTVAYDAANNRASFTAAQPLDVSATYTATLTTEIANTAGVNMASEYSWSFTTFDANPDQIVINLDYGGPYELSSNYPVWLEFVPNPWDYPVGGETAFQTKVTSPGTVIVDVADLPLDEAEDGTFWLYLIHDLSNDHTAFPYDGPTISTEGAYVDNGGDNFTTDVLSVFTSYPADSSDPTPYIAIPDAQIAPGNAYSVTLTDDPLVASDSYEDDSTFDSANVPTASFATVYSRTIGWDDTDWFRFVPSQSGMYRFVVADSLTSAYDESSLTLGIPVELGVYRYETGTASLSHKQTDYDDPLTASDDFGLVDVYLSSGYTFYIKVSSTERIDVGSYLFEVILATAPADGDEPNDSYVPGGGMTELQLGYANGIERTFHTGWDNDFYYIDTTGILLPGVRMALMTAVPSDSTVLPGSALRWTYSDYHRTTLDLEAGFYSDDDRGDGRPSTVYGADQSSGGFADAYVNFDPSPLVLYAVEVASQGTTHSSGLFPYTAAYWLGLLYGPEAEEFAPGDDPQLPSGLNNTADTTLGALSVDGSSGYRAIYPKGDVDYVRFYTGSYTTVYVSFAPAGASADDVYVQFDLYDNGGSYMSGSYGGNGSVTGATIAGLSTSSYYFLRFETSSNSPSPTGAYEVWVTSTP